MTQITENIVLQKLSTVMDPELNRDLVSLNMIHDIVIKGDVVHFKLLLTTPACPLRGQIENAAKRAVGSIPGVREVQIEMGAQISRSAMLDEKIELNIKNTIAVASGKGGVGKTTIAVNLAVALANAGAKVGLLDADIYGPNVPVMMGLSTLPQPQNNKLIPAESYGVKVMSIGFMVKDLQPLIWRGPLLHSTINQFLTEVEWGELDYLIVDLPPGTGDVQLSLSQTIPLSGGIIVTLPQKVSTDDAGRGLEMFRKMNIPIIGVVENMSYLCMPDGSRMDIFGSGGGEKFANDMHVSFLGAIPMQPSVRENSDKGTPFILTDKESEAARVFDEIACAVAAKVSVMNFQTEK